MPYLRGDSLHAVWVAVHILRRRFIDQNGQVDAFGVWWIMHWSLLRRGGYRWLFTYKHDAKGREIRVRVPKTRKVQHCPTGYVERLRTRKRGGRRPHKAAEHFTHWADEDVTGCLEGKGTVTKAPQESYDELVADALASGCRMVFMTLQSIPGWRTRLRKMHAAGVRNGVTVPLALLPRGRKPADWSEFEDIGVQVWGRWKR
jgi:hypothetical protein